MNDKFHEELSALMDGELSELELRRLLKQGAEDPQLLEKWQRWNRVRSVLRGDHRDACLPIARLDLTQRVAAALVQEDAHVWSDSAALAAPTASNTSVNTPASSWRDTLLKPFASVAVAASVSAMVVVGWQTVSGGPAGPAFVQQGGAPVARVASTLPQTSMTSGAVPVAQYQGAGQQPFASNTLRISGGPQPDIIRISDQEYDERLRRYLISHSGNAAQHTASGTYSYARAVSLKPATSQP